MKAALCKVEEIPADGSLAVPFFGREVLVYQVDGRPRAVANACLHLGGPLEDKGDCLVCPWHGARYAKADGYKQEGPGRADARLMFLPTRVEDGILSYTGGCRFRVVVWSECALAALTAIRRADPHHL